VSPLESRQVVTTLAPLIAVLAAVTTLIALRRARSSVCLSALILSSLIRLSSITCTPVRY
jgi:hypothetical protein